MRDDFAALDFLSAAAFRAANRKLAKKMAKKIAKQQKKALLGFPRRAARSNVQRPLTELLPIIATKVKKPQIGAPLRGWPVALHWSAPDLLANQEREEFPDVNTLFQ